MRHGGQILVDQLRIMGTQRIFSVPGESFLAVLDGLYESDIQNIVCRHEGGAAMMAEAHAKLTGDVGVAFVTRGPGATNAACGVHIAAQDSTPMILFVGQIARDHRDRDAFQEVHYRSVFGGLAKWVAEVDQTARLPEYIARAFQVARAGRPGPVVLALPEDMLSDAAQVADAALPVQIAPQVDVAPIVERLSQAQRPLVVAGGPGWTAQATRDLDRFARAWQLPVATDFRRQDYLDNRHPCYVGDLSVGGNPALRARLAQSDCLLVLGARLGDIATDGYTALDPAAPQPAMLHVYPDAAELGRVYRPGLQMAASAPQVLAALGDAPVQPRDPAWRDALLADYHAWRTPVATPGDLQLEQVMHWLSDTLPEDAIVTNGAGNYAAFLHRYYQYKGHGTQLAPTSGSMGYGIPAAIAAKIACPDRVVVAMAGDGCFQMTLNELSTAAQYGAAIIVIVVNNGRYGTIRMHQERTYPARVSGTDLFNPNFAQIVQAYGGHGETVTRTQDFAAAFQRAQASGTVALIELVTNDEVLAPGATLSQARTQGENRTV